MNSSEEIFLSKQIHRQKKLFYFSWLFPLLIFIVALGNLYTSYSISVQASIPPFSILDSLENKESYSKWHIVAREQATKGLFYFGLGIVITTFSFSTFKQNSKFISIIKSLSEKN